MNIRVHIERLVLDGLPISRHDGPAVQAAVEAELGRLLAAGELSPELRAGGALASVRANSINVKKDSTPASVGQQIAGSLSSTLT